MTTDQLPPNRSTSPDKDIGRLEAQNEEILRRLARQDKATEKRDEKDDAKHKENKTSLDHLADLVPTVNDHARRIQIQEDWREKDVDPFIKKLNNKVIEYRGVSKGVIIGCTLGGGAVGAFLIKLASAIAITMAHTP